MLKKREQFAVSLRSKKKRSILKAKSLACAAKIKQIHDELGEEVERQKET